MTDKQFGKALLSLESTPRPSDIDPRQMARNVVSRDRRRVRWLAALTAFFWTVTTGGLFYVVLRSSMIVVPRFNAYAVDRANVATDWQDWALAINLGFQALLICLVGFLLAALSTVALVLFSRHATLRQINASLAELTERLTPAATEAS